MSNLSSLSTTLTATFLLAASAAVSLPACSESTPHANTPESRSAKEQVIVERSAMAFDELRKNPRFAKMDSYLKRARGVMIFPRVVKASLIFGGEGGNGVLVARKADGTWSSPAFYSIGAPSLGLQLGYQQATVVLFIMDDGTVNRALESSFSLGTKAGATIGDVDNDRTAGGVVTANIYQVVSAEGVYAGVSLDGYVIGSRERHNHDYYGRAVTPRDILIEDTAHKPEAVILDKALTMQAEPMKLQAAAR